MILGLCGVAGSGKDQAAKYMIKYMKSLYKSTGALIPGDLPGSYTYGQGLVYRTAFADALKKVCCVLEGRAGDWSDKPKSFYADFYGETGKVEVVSSLGLTRRDLFQKVGQALRDSISEDVFVAPIIEEYYRVMQAWRDGWALTPEEDRPFLDIPPLCIIPDVRYTNEVDAIHRAGGRVFYVERPNNPRYDAMSMDQRHHPSVPSENKWNLPILDNSKDLPWFSRRSQEIVRQLLLDEIDPASLTYRRLDRVLE